MSESTVSEKSQHKNSPALSPLPHPSKITHFSTQYRFVESIGASLCSPFRRKEDIIAHYQKLGYVNIELSNALDNDGNILAYSFEVLCYKKDNKNVAEEKKKIGGSTPFVQGV